MWIFSHKFCILVSHAIQNQNALSLEGHNPDVINHSPITSFSTTVSEKFSE